MPYTKQDLVELSGLSERTIRRCMERGWVPRPKGHGPAAVYGDEHLVRVIAIRRLRDEGRLLDDVGAHIAGWTTARFKQYVARTDPKAPAAAPADSPIAQTDAAPAPPTAADASEPAPPPVLTPALPFAAAAPVEAHEPITDVVLTAGPSVRFLPLLPGLALALQSDAPLVVQRIAAEIMQRYGSR